MAHLTAITGEVSELTAASLLLTELGWEVSRPIVPEAYDLLARNPKSGEYTRIQVKTIRRRKDRLNQPVVYASKNNGDAYTPDEVDYIIGVERQTAYMFKCRGKKEYWLSENNIENSVTQYKILGA
ncbi:hypothetical protein MFLO_15810 [Listeria floridensis FSL S10-1187]|uniref:PD(D/E)XK endonuclease domain-containing protein n=1 Tax=Listeria floridensis FSL S10-1187 TaxID=1265817 RepID=A0ABP3ATJ0_9LIST|nr:group I intron-associated PD-(D/E)XK endonuclease [Listeria floridensis]EUJ23747.1 hypothetical protein MFLO_15810 [Listeria floridensis FSL S10-1187]